MAPNVNKVASEIVKIFEKYNGQNRKEAIKKELKRLDLNQMDVVSITNTITQNQCGEGDLKYAIAAAVRNKNK